MNDAAQHGGKRDGAGRKPAPTKTVRVPEGTESIVRALVNLVHAKAVEALRETKWYTSAPAHLKELPPVVTFERIEDFPIYVSVGGLDGNSYPAPFAVFSTTLGEFKGTFRMRLDIGAQGAVMMDEADA